jgi:DNA-binding MarR family transcriptional regulator
MAESTRTRQHRQVARAARMTAPGRVHGRASRGTGGVLRQMREVCRLLQRHLRNVEALAGLHSSELWALAELDVHPGLKISDLAAALSVHAATASNLLDRLQRRSLVRRERDDIDQRIVRVNLTAAGRKVLRNARHAWSATPAALDCLPADSLTRLSRD